MSSFPGTTCDSVSYQTPPGSNHCSGLLGCSWGGCHGQSNGCSDLLGCSIGNCTPPVSAANCAQAAGGSFGCTSPLNPLNPTCIPGTTGGSNGCSGLLGCSWSGCLAGAAANVTPNQGQAAMNPYLQGPIATHYLYCPPHMAAAGGGSNGCSGVIGCSFGGCMGADHSADHRRAGLRRVLELRRRRRVMASRSGSPTPAWVLIPAWITSRGSGHF